MNDPVRGCEVYKNNGCSHVDGYLCDYPDCSIRKNYMSIQEKIDILAKQCYSYDHLNFDYNRFAKMIAIECAEAVKNSIWHLPRGYKAEDQAEFIKKHFGIEE